MHDNDNDNNKKKKNRINSMKTIPAPERKRNASNYM